MSLRFNLIKDIDTFKNDALMGLTFKEVVLCGIAIISGGTTFFITKNIIGDDLASLLCLLVASPFGITALYKKNGMSFFEYLKASYNLKFKNNTLYFSSYDVDLLDVSKMSINNSNIEHIGLFEQVANKILNKKKNKEGK